MIMTGLESRGCPLMIDIRRDRRMAECQWREEPLAELQNVAELRDLFD